MAAQLGETNLNLIRGDALRFLSTALRPYDIVFADPPYDMPGFAAIPAAILNSGAVAPGTIVIVEHNRTHDFSSLPGFMDHRTYGSVNFSIFQVPERD